VYQQLPSLQAAPNQWLTRTAAPERRMAGMRCERMASGRTHFGGMGAEDGFLASFHEWRPLYESGLGGLQAVKLEQSEAKGRPFRPLEHDNRAPASPRSP
jgi:hypothetical protein